MRLENHVAVVTECGNGNFARSGTIGTLDEQLDRLMQRVGEPAAFARSIRQERGLDSLLLECVLKRKQVESSHIDRIPGELLHVLGNNHPIVVIHC